MKEKYLNLAAAMLAIVFMAPVLSKTWELCFFPHPVGIREGAMIETTEEMRSGINPYRWEQMPEHMNMYGIFYPTVVLPFYSLFDSPGEFTSHRLVNLFSYLMIGVLILWLLIRRGVPWGLGLMGVAIYFRTIFMSRALIEARPDGIGLLLCLLSLFIPHEKKYSPVSLVFSGLCVVLAWFTKLYFAYAIAAVPVYLFLFVNKKKAVIYAAGTALAIVLIELALYPFFPALPHTTFFIYFEVATHSLEHMFKMMGEYYVAQFPFLSSAVLISLILYFRKNPLRRALVLDPIIYQFIFSQFVLFKLQQHTGSNEYFYELAGPHAVLVALLLFNEFNPKKLGWLLLVPMGIWVLKDYPRMVRPLPEALTQWDAVENYYKKVDGPVYTSMAVSHLALKMGRPIHDNGHTSYFLTEKNDVSPFENRAKAITEKFCEGQRAKIAARYFKTVVLSGDYDVLCAGGRRFLVENYQSDRLFKPYFYKGNNRNIEFFVPKK